MLQILELHTLKLLPMRIPEKAVLGEGGWGANFFNSSVMAYCEKAQQECVLLAKQGLSKWQGIRILH